LRNFLPLAAFTETVRGAKIMALSVADNDQVLQPVNTSQSAIDSVTKNESPEPTTGADGHLPGVKRRLTFICLGLGFSVLYVARDFFMPVMLGVLIALTLRPIMRWLEKHGIPPEPAAFTIVPSLAFIIGLGLYAVSGPFIEMVQSAPDIARQLQARFQDLLPQLKAVQEASQSVEQITSGSGNQTTQRVVIEQAGLVASAASTMARGLTTIGIAALFAVFLLSTGTLFYEKLIAIMPSLSEKKRALRIVYDIETQVSNYLLTITLINIVLGALVGVTLWAYGFENPFVWGAVAAVMNYLPIIGPMIAVAGLAVLSLATSATLFAGFIPPAIYLAFHLVEGNLVTPMVLGRRLSLNVVAVFLTVILWGWLWGIAGALIAVPFLVVLKVAADNIEGMKNLSEFLGGRATLVGGNT
jgi:predicted PurR-regulated permease PerM